MWEVRAYRSYPMRYAGTELRGPLTEAEANNISRALRRTEGYFCVEKREIRPAYFWLGAQAEAAHG